MEERLGKNENMKTAMMLMVVLYHSCLFFGGSWFTEVQPVYTAKALVVFAKYLNTVHVQTFTMASGFLFYAQRKEKGKYKDDFRADVSRRAKRLLIPYGFTMVFWVIPFSIAYNGIDVSDIVYKYGLGCAPSQLWFLPMLFWLFLIHYGLFRWKEPNKIGLCISIVLSTIGGSVLNKLGVPNVFQLVTTLRYMMFYYLGAYLYHRKPWMSVRRIILWGAFSIVAFALSLWDWSSIVGKLLVMLVGRLGSLGGVLAIYGIFALLPAGKEKGALRNLLQRDSFGIYLFHQQLIYPSILLLNGKVHPTVQVVLCFLIAILGAVMITELLRKCKLTESVLQL